MAEAFHQLWQPPDDVLKDWRVVEGAAVHANKGRDPRPASGHGAPPRRIRVCTADRVKRLGARSGPTSRAALDGRPGLTSKELAVPEPILAVERSHHSPARIARKAPEETPRRPVAA